MPERSNSQARGGHLPGRAVWACKRANIRGKTGGGGRRVFYSVRQGSPDFLNSPASSPGITIFFFFCFESVIYTPLHAARRAMAAVVPLPLAGQRRAFIKKTFSYPEPACAVIVRCPSAPAPHGPPYTRKRKKRPSHREKERKARRKQKRVYCPLLLHFHGSLSCPFLLRHSNLRLTLFFPLGGRGSLLGSLGSLALLPPLWGRRSPSSSLPPGLPLGSAGVIPRSVRSSTVGTFYRSMRAWAAKYRLYDSRYYIF